MARTRTGSGVTKRRAGRLAARTAFWREATARPALLRAAAVSRAPPAACFGRAALRARPLLRQHLGAAHQSVVVTRPGLRGEVFVLQLVATPSRGCAQVLPRHARFAAPLDARFRWSRFGAAPDQAHAPGLGLGRPLRE